MENCGQIFSKSLHGTCGKNVPRIKCRHPVQPYIKFEDDEEFTFYKRRKELQELCNKFDCLMMIGTNLENQLPT